MRRFPRERELWPSLYRLLREVAMDFPQKYVQMQPWVRVAVMLWAALLDRPLRPRGRRRRQRLQAAYGLVEPGRVQGLGDHAVERRREGGGRAVDRPVGVWGPSCSLTSSASATDNDLRPSLQDVEEFGNEGRRHNTTPARMTPPPTRSASEGFRPNPSLALRVGGRSLSAEVLTKRQGVLLLALECLLCVLCVFVVNRLDRSRSASR